MLYDILYENILTLFNENQKYFLIDIFESEWNPIRICDVFFSRDDNIYILESESFEKLEKDFLRGYDNVKMCRGLILIKLRFLMMKIDLSLKQEIS